MPLADIVQVQITAVTGGLTLAGFGTPLILGGYSKSYPERVRYYASDTALASDFPAGTPEYAAAAAIFGQDPAPTQVGVGRCALPPTQHWTVTPLVTLENVPYVLTIGGIDYTFTDTVDTSPTAAQIVAGLIAVVNAATGTHGLTAAGTNALTLTAAPGAWQSVQVGNVNYLSIVQDHADPGIATDLDAIALESPDWYSVVNPWNSTAELLATAHWVEANGKQYLAQTQETQAINTTAAYEATIASGPVSAAYQAMQLGYKRTAVVYDPSNGAFLDAGMLGACLPLTPGSETWALKSIAGVPARTYTGTQIVNMQSKNCGYYYTVAGRNITMQGKVCDAEFIDTIRFLDWQTQDIQGAVFLLLANASGKIPYTDAGATLVQAAVLTSLQRGEDVGGLVKGSSKVTVPLVASQAPSDVANRFMPGVGFTALLAGAIHKVQIQGTVTV